MDRDGNRSSGCLVMGKERDYGSNRGPVRYLSLLLVYGSSYTRNWVLRCSRSHI